jgi:hypothetical protein
MHTKYVQHLHTTLGDVRIGEKVLLVYRPDYDASARVTNGVVASVSPTTVRVVWESNDPPPLDTFTEDQLCLLAFEQPEPVIQLDML